MAKKEGFEEEFPVLLDNVDEDGVQVSSMLSEDGRLEYPDPIPMRPPVGYKAEPDIYSMIKRMVHQELSGAADLLDADTFEEAEDFDIEDDPLDELTPYEKVFEPKPSPVPAVDQHTSGAKVAGEGDPQPTGVPPTPASDVKEGNSTST